MNYLLSYPRTLSSFIRYCVEKISNQRTLDCGGYHDRIYGINTPGRPILRKEHFLKGIEGNVDSVILILRNYKDVFISHNLRHIPLTEVDVIYDKFNSNKHYFREYYGLIDFYDKYQDEKLLLYYEDIISNSYMDIKKVINFIFPNNNFSINEQIISDLKIQSKSSYTNSQGSKTTEVKDLHKILTPEQNNNIDTKFRDFNVEMYDKYLSRYSHKK